MSKRTVQGTPCQPAPSPLEVYLLCNKKNPTVIKLLTNPIPHSIKINREEVVFSQSCSGKTKNLHSHLAAG